MSLEFVCTNSIEPIVLKATAFEIFFGTLHTFRRLRELLKLLETFGKDFLRGSQCWGDKLKEKTNRPPKHKSLFV